MRHFVAAVAAVVILSLPALAQQQLPIELGLDAAIGYTLDSPHITQVIVPVQRIRAGFFVSPTISLEPSIAFLHSSEGETHLSAGAGALLHFSALRSATQPYVRPFVEINHSSFDFVAGSDTSPFSTTPTTVSFTTTTLGAGAGVKIPIANRFAWRLEGAVARTLERDLVKASTSLRGFVGLSFFTR